MTRFPAACGAVLVALALCSGLAGCGGSSSSPTATPTPAPTPTPTVRAVIDQIAFHRFYPSVWVGIEVPVSNRGVIDITVDWTSDETWMYVYFGDTACVYRELDTGTCPFLIVSETKEPKPRVLYTGRVGPGMYYLYLYNLPRVPFTEVGSDFVEAVSIQIGLTVEVV